MREDGQRLTYGNRREYCPNNPSTARIRCRIVTAMAEHYAGNPAVIGWQIDNEFGDRCYCPVCRQAFSDWLRAALRLAGRSSTQAGARSSGATCTTTGRQIPLRARRAGAPNPGLALDFTRFCSDSYVDYQKLQVDILREAVPGALHHSQLHGLRLRADSTTSTWHATWTWWPGTTTRAPMAHGGGRGRQRPGPGPRYDARAQGQRQNFWVMEEQAGPGGWEMVSVPPRPGEIRLWAYQAIAHGADAIVFFRWRTARFGTEEYWHGILDHHGNRAGAMMKSSRWAPSSSASARASRARVQPPVAMMQDYDSRFAFQIQPNNPGFAYPRHFQEVYRALHARQVSIDVVSPGHDLSGYRLVVAPALHVVSPALAEKLEAFVGQGGVLVLTARSGVKDPANSVVDRYLPGLLAGLAGVHVEDYDSLPEGAWVGLELALPRLDPSAAGLSGEQAAESRPDGMLYATTWCDILAGDGAQVVARYTQDYYAGCPAITLNRYGKGQVVYIGTLGPAGLFEALAPWLLALGGVQPVMHAPAGVEVAERREGERRLLFVLNHSEQAQTITLPRAYRDRLDGDRPVSGPVTLPAKGVMVLE